MFVQTPYRNALVLRVLKQMVMKISIDLISEAWLKLSKDSVIYVDQWLYNETVFRIIKTH